MDLQISCARAAELHKRGHVVEAERLYREVLAVAPDYVPALSLLGVLVSQAGHKDDALALMRKAVALGPDAIPALMNYAVLLGELGRTEEALAQLARVTAIQPGNVPAHVLAGNILQAANRLEEALANFDMALALKNDLAVALNNRGNTLVSMGRLEEAVASFDRALALEPANDSAWYNRGTALQVMKRFDQAVASYNRALALKPGFALALNNRGNALRLLGRADEALADFNQAVALEPGNVAAHFNRATMFGDLKRDGEALAGFDQVLAAEPDNFAALASRGYLHWDRFRNYEPAVRDLERAVAINPDFEYVRGDLLHLKMLGGDWRDFETELARIDEAVRAGKKAIRPFAYQALSELPRDLQTCAVTYTANVFPPAVPLWKGSARGHEKIRLGYLCGAFSKHALAYLAAGLYEAHDRAAFEIIALDSGRGDNSAIRARLEAGFDKFISIAEMSDEAAAQRILAEEIDILVNVDGYSGNMRMGVFARRPAPIQVNWLGFPGTLGASCMDYIIADPVVIADGDRAFYTEKIVTMPHAYQVNDSRRAIARTTPDRATHGLPRDGFVFCNFNQSYKLTPAIFACWMRIMNAVPDSVLWLLEAGPVFAGNLRAKAQRQGVSGERLVFAPIIPIEEHLARLALGDLFLDTLPYNAHTTASDALWAGLPLLTCEGTAFAGRVAASLLTVVGVPELVAHDMREYERLALRLAGDKRLLASIREKVLANRAKTPLFDTDGYRKALENAYRAMWARRAEAPCDFHVDAV